MIAPGEFVTDAVSILINKRGPWGYQHPQGQGAQTCCPFPLDRLTLHLTGGGSGHLLGMSEETHAG